MIATGASAKWEVMEAMNILSKYDIEICLMQCNTNYTADHENFKYINLNVLKDYQKEWPNIKLGLSDHTPGDVTVLGAVALGATIIEKHFTDNNKRRSIRATKDLPKDHVLQEEDLIELRPCPADAIPPGTNLIGESLIKNIKQNDYLTYKHIE